MITLDINNVAEVRKAVADAKVNVQTGKVSTVITQCNYTPSPVVVGTNMMFSGYGFWFDLLLTSLPFGCFIVYYTDINLTHLSHG